MFRTTLFWIHLTCGVITGLVIFSMSLTGVLLTYERQINQWLAQSHYVPESEQRSRLSLDELLELQRRRQPELEATTLTLENDAGAPVQLRAGRRGGVALNPYTGEEMETGSPTMEKVFRGLMTFHRWFSLEGEQRDIGRQITGISNLAFLFLVLSGIYLWFPKIFRWTMFKARLWFRGSYPNGKARDYHWHHIFGIWMAIPLIAVIYTGSMFYYGWASDAVYAALGTERPGRGPAPQAAAAAQGGNVAARPGGANGAAARTQQRVGSEPVERPVTFLTLQALADSAAAGIERPWKRLNLSLPRDGQHEVEVELDWGNGAQQHKRATLSLDRSSGEILAVENYSDIPTAQKVRGVQRFLHTGELFGFWGQTIAGLASLAALFMVWTGFALSYRRLIAPLLKKKTG